MNGPEHYVEAERFLTIHEEMLAEGAKASQDRSLETQAAAASIAQVPLHAAQVHATLALAAATASPLQRIEPAGTVPDGKARRWFEVLS